MEDKKAFAGKLPGCPPSKKRKTKSQLPSPHEPYSRLDSKQFKQLIGGKPSYPCYLDFNMRDFALKSLDFLLGCENIFKEIDVSNNRLVDCSTGVFEHLTKLKCLIIDNNALLDIQFKGLQSLTTLSLMNNQLNFLNDMSDLKNLVYLDLSGNKLEAGFDQLFKLKSLKVLDLGNNGISLPLSDFWRTFNGLSRLPKLQYLSFAGNPCVASINKFRLFAINEYKQIKYLDWQEITKEERGSAAKLDAEGEWKDKTAVLEKKASRNRFSGLAAVSERLKEEKEKRMSRGSAQKSITLPKPDKGAQLDELIDSLIKADPLDDLIGDDGDDLAASGADPLDDLLDYLSEGTKSLDSIVVTPKSPPAQPGGTVDNLALLNSILQESGNNKPVPNPEPAKPAKSDPQEDYLGVLIDMINTTGFEEKTQEKEIENPKSITQPAPVPSDDSIFDMLDELMESKPRKNSATTVDIAAVEKSLAEFENSLSGIPTRKGSEQKVANIELERLKHEEEIKKLKQQQQQELERQRLESEQEKQRLLELAAREKSERRKTQQLLELLVEEDKNKEELQRKRQEPQNQAKNDAKALLDEARQKRASMERRKLTAELDQASTPLPARDFGSLPPAPSKQSTPAPSPVRQQPLPSVLSPVKPPPSPALPATAVDELMRDLLAVEFPAPVEVPPPVEIVLPKTWLCRYDEIQFGEKMGLGSYGTSFRGALRGKGPVVIKKLLCQRFKDSFIEALKDEASRLSSLKHPRLAEWKSLCTDTDLCIATEYVDGINLQAYLQDPKNTVSMTWALEVAKSTAEAMAFLHSNNVIHRCLKPSNIIVDKDGRVKITDYGMVMVKDEVARSGQIGLPQYAAPEVIMKVEATEKADVYSYAMMLCELFSRMAPFQGLLPREVAIAVTERNQRPAVPVCPFVFTRLIQACWNGIPQKRPTFDMVVKILSQPQDQVLSFPPEVEPRDTVPHPSQNVRPPASVATRPPPDGQAGQVIERIIQMLESPDIQQHLKALRATYNFSADETNRRAVVDSPLVPILMQICANAEDIIKEQAVVVIGLLAEGEYNANKLGEEGVMAALLAMCTSGNNDMIVVKSLKALERLAAQSPQNIDRAGETVVSILLGILSNSSNELLRLQLVAALAAFLPKESNQLLFYKLGGMQVLLNMLSTSQNSGVLLRVVEALAMLTTNEKMETIVQRVGVLPRLIALLDMKSPLLQQQAVQNVAKFAKRPALREEMCRSGVIVSLIRVFAEGISDEKTLAQVAQILGDFITDGDRAILVQQYGGVSPYIRALHSPSYKEETKIHIAQLILHLLQHEDNQKDLIAKGGLQILLEVASTPGCLEELQVHILGCLHILSTNEGALVIMGRGGAIGLLASQFLDSKREQIQSKAVGILALLSAMKDNKDLFPDADAICGLVPLVDSLDEETKKGALTALANLADHENCRRIMLEEGALVPIIKAMNQTGDSRLMERLIWALSYFALDVDCHEDIINQGLGVIVDLLLLDKMSIVSLALKTLLLLLVKSEKSRAAAKNAGLVAKATALLPSQNRAVAAAAQKVLTFLG